MENGENPRGNQKLDSMITEDFGRAHQTEQKDSLKGKPMATPLDPKEIVTVQDIATSNMLEIEALR